MVVLLGLSLGMTLARDGEMKKPEKHSFFVSLIGTAITVGLLYWGGFFPALT